MTNETGTMKQGTCRIFLIPKVDEREQPLRFREQRLFAIEMDKFLAHCMLMSYHTTFEIFLTHLLLSIFLIYDSKSGRKQYSSTFR